MHKVGFPHRKVWSADRERTAPSGGTVCTGGYTGGVVGWSHGRYLLGACIVFALGCILLVMLLTVAGCSTQTEQSSGVSNTTTATTSTDVRVASLKGPTSIGLVGLMDEVDAGQLVNNYTFTIAGSVDEILPDIIQGTVDIALVPANTAATLYQKTNGGISVIDVNTLGVLYVVTGDSSISSLADLAGKTVYMTGKGTTPEYVMDYLLAENGLTGQVSLEFESEATEVASLLAADPSAIGILPEPYVTSVETKSPTLKTAISLTDEWDKLQGGSGSQLVTGVTIVRNEFLEDHPEAVAEFLAAHASSVTYVNDNPSQAASDVVAAGIIDNETVAAAAIPNCNVVCLTGEDMKAALSGYYNVLYQQDPSSVGGSLPDDAFYYLKAS
jgi:NitT/TauT family transport system substrate-binding protein